jgi:hypothetical protein
MTSKESPHILNDISEQDLRYAADAGHNPLDEKALASPDSGIANTRAGRVTLLEDYGASAVVIDERPATPLFDCKSSSLGGRGQLGRIVSGSAWVEQHKCREAGNRVIRLPRSQFSEDSANLGCGCDASASRRS